MNRPKAHAAVRGKLKQKKGSLEIAGMNVKLLRGMRGLTQEKQIRRMLALPCLVAFLVLVVAGCN